MIVVMRRDAAKREVEETEREIREMGCAAHALYGADRVVIRAVGARGENISRRLGALPAVELAIPVLGACGLTGRELHKGRTLVEVGKSVTFNGRRIPVIVGPCCEQSREHIHTVTEAAGAAGAAVLQGNTGEQGGLPVCVDVAAARSVSHPDRSADMLCVSARNLQDFDLLEAVGRQDRPVLLERGSNHSVGEWLLSVEYVMAQGNRNVILCESGVCPFAMASRPTLDLSVVALLKQKTHLPVVVAPCSALGRSESVEGMVLASIAAGADGVMIKVRAGPCDTLSGCPSAIPPARFAALMAKMRRVAEAVGREV